MAAGDTQGWVSLGGYVQGASGAVWQDYAGQGGTSNVWAAQGCIDTAGWVQLRGLVWTSSGAYSYNAASAVIMFLPAQFRHPTRWHMFACQGTDKSGVDYLARVDVFPNTSPPNGWAGGVQLVRQIAGGSNSGQAAYVDLGSIRYNINA